METRIGANIPTHATRVHKQTYINKFKTNTFTFNLQHYANMTHSLYSSRLVALRKAVYTRMMTRLCLTLLAYAWTFTHKRALEHKIIPSLLPLTHTAPT